MIDINNPSFTLAILTDNNHQWRPHCYQSSVWNKRILNFYFYPIKLLDYQSKEAELENSNNPFGIIVLAQLAALKTSKTPKTRFNQKFALTCRLYDKGLNRDDILNLHKFIDWLLTLPKALEIEYNQCIDQLEKEKQVSYITSYDRIATQKWFEKGIEQGVQKGEYMLLLSLLQHRFREIPETYITQVKQAKADKLLKWGTRLLEAQNLKDIFTEE